MFVGRHVYNCHLAIFWKFNSVPDVSNVLKLPTPILLEVSLSTMGTVFVGFHLRIRQHIIYFHWSSPFQNYLAIFPFTIVFYFLFFLNFRIPIARNLIILLFLSLIKSIPKLSLYFSFVLEVSHSYNSYSHHSVFSSIALFHLTQIWTPRSNYYHFYKRSQQSHTFQKRRKKSNSRALGYLHVSRISSFDFRVRRSNILMKHWEIIKTKWKVKRIS